MKKYWYCEDHRYGWMSEDQSDDVAASYYLASEVEARIAELEEFVRRTKKLADERHHVGDYGEHNDYDMIGLSLEASKLLGL